MATLPWDCTVPGIPASLQAKGKKRPDWKARVRAAAAARWPPDELPLTGPLAVAVVFMHHGEPVDVDNMLKPTLDGLQGVIYEDDSQIDQVLGIRHDLDRAVRLSDLSPTLLGAVVQSLTDDSPFVYIRVARPAELEELLR